METWSTESREKRIRNGRENYYRRKGPCRKIDLPGQVPPAVSNVKRIIHRNQVIRVGLLNVAWNSRQRGGYEVRKISDQSDRDLILGAVRQRYGFAIGESLLVSK